MIDLWYVDHLKVISTSHTISSGALGATLEAALKSSAYSEGPT
jgi:hypothetical protein